MIKILFVLYNSESSSLIKKLSILNLIDELRFNGENYCIGLISNNNITLKTTANANIKLNNEAIINNFWNIIVLQDEPDFTLIADSPIIAHNPAIALILDFKLEQPFYLSLQNQIFIGSSPKNLSEIERYNTKFVETIPCQDLNLKFRKRFKKYPANLLYYISDDTDLNNSLKFINFFNDRADIYNVYILCNERIKSILYKFTCNSIKILNLNESLSEPYNYVLASGKIALSAILSEIPTIVLGKYGYGGLVTPNNVTKHFENHFMGRIGGDSNEAVPCEIVHSEIQNIYNYKYANRDYLSTNRTIIAETMLSNKFSFVNFITKCTQMI